MIFGKPKDAKPSLWSPQIPLVPQPWLPWLLILRTGRAPSLNHRGEEVADVEVPFYYQ